MKDSIPEKPTQRTFDFDRMDDLPAEQPALEIAPYVHKKCCPKCKEVFPATLKYFSQKNGKLRACRRCEVKYSAEWKEKNPEKYAKRQRDWREKNPHYRLEWVYGLSYDEYLDLLKQQDNACKICKQPFSDKNKANIDH